MFDLLKHTQNCPNPLIQVVSSLRKLSKAVLAREKQGNLQPTLNKRGGIKTVMSFKRSKIEEFLKKVFQGIKKVLPKNGLL